MNSFDNIYLTGDKHADFEDLVKKSSRYGLTDRDLLIILGDVGINYFGDCRDDRQKDILAALKPTVLCIRGNHELRPTDPILCGKYKAFTWMGDAAYVEDAYPKIIMAKDGARYHINGREFLVIGGAYSVDKERRLLWGYRWFEDEQLTAEEMERIRKNVTDHGSREDIILAHTCPYDHRPVEAFLPGLDESKVDNSMERFLQEIIDTADYNQFYCGHWHIDKCDEKIRFLFHDIVALGK